MAPFTKGSFLVAPLLFAALTAIGEEPLQVRDVLRRALEAADATGSTYNRHGIPSALARAGDLEAALVAVEGMTPDAHEREQIAIAQAKAKDLAGAVKTANSIASEDGKSRALTQIAGVLAERGDAPAALEITKQITDPVALTGAVAIIAQAQARSGHIDAAIETANSIPDVADLKVNALFEIALAQAKRASIADALQSAALVKSDVNRIILLASIAEILADQGKMGEAKEVLQKALAALGPTRIDRHAFALTKIATVQLKLGDRTTARTTFREAVLLRDHKNQRGVVFAQAKAGDIEGALENARTGRMGGQIGQGLELIATVQAASGDLKGALDTAESIESVETRSTSLAQVAAAQRASGHLAEAATTFQKALATAQTDLGDPREQVRRRALYSIAYQQAKSGDEQTALNWASKEPNKLIQSRALLGIAEGMLARKEAEAAANTGRPKRP